MSDDNNFLKSYGEDLKKTPDTPKGKAGYRYEEKSGFIKPAGTGGSGPRGRKPVRLLGPIIGGALVVVAIIVTVLLLSNKAVSVIDLTGWTVNDARLWANEKGVMLQEEEFYNDSFDENVIFAQDVSPGQRMEKGDFIKLSVSLGHDLTVTLPLPDLNSMTMEEVEAWADENYMTKVRITAEYSDTVPEGGVIRYEINDDTVVTEVRRDTPIYVIVSKGSVEESNVQIAVPDFKTMSVAEGFVFANENGITLTVEEQYDDYVPKGAVISQSVKKDKKISRGGEIKLIVSKGKKVIIPDFSKYSKDMASTVASQLGIPIIQTQWYSSAKAGSFLSQSIKADTVYQDGDVLELKYSLSNRINVPSFVDQTQGDMEVWVEELNQKGARIALTINATMSGSPKGTITYQDKANITIGPNEAIFITVSSGSLIHTPDFVGLGTDYDDAITREMAIEMCEALHIIPNFIEEHHSGFLPGEIWYQDVLAGTEIEEGTIITLRYNPNDKWTDVPDFVGETYDDVKKGSSIYNHSIKKIYIVIEGSGNEVVAQSVPQNTRVAYGTKVVLTLGN